MLPTRSMHTEVANFAAKLLDGELQVIKICRRLTRMILVLRCKVDNTCLPMCMHRVPPVLVWYAVCRIHQIYFLLQIISCPCIQQSRALLTFIVESIISWISRVGLGLINKHLFYSLLSTLVAILLSVWTDSILKQGLDKLLNSCPWINIIIIAICAWFVLLIDIFVSVGFLFAKII